MDVCAEIVTYEGGHRAVITAGGRRISTPPVEHLLFYAGLAVLVEAGMVELPVALAVGVGHALIDLTRRPSLVAIGEALEEA